jgi:hypothetical protein
VDTRGVWYLGLGGVISMGGSLGHRTSLGLVRRISGTYSLYIASWGRLCIIHPNHFTEKTHSRLLETQACGDVTPVRCTLGSSAGDQSLLSCYQSAHASTILSSDARLSSKGTRTYCRCILVWIRSGDGLPNPDLRLPLCANA